MDPELYVFDKIERPVLKIAASSVLFAVVTAAVWLLLPGSRLWNALGTDLAHWAALAAGYPVFLYGSLAAWRAARLKNSVEDPARRAPNRLLETGPYALTRHPMYGMFIMANAGLGLAANSIYGLAFSLLSLALYCLNGVFEERAVLIPMFGERYRAYMRRVPARYFTLPQAVLLAATLAANIARALLR